MAKYIKLLTLMFMVTAAVHSALGCAFTINFTRNQPTCGSNGTLSYSISPAPNAGAKYSVYKNGVSLVTINGNIANLNSLAPGSYKVVVTDNQTGCTDSLDNVILDVAVNSLSATFTKDSTRCDTSHDAKISVKVKNATYPVTYKWRKELIDLPLEKDSFIDSLYVGSYHVTITDFSNCRFEILDIKIKEIQGKMYAIDTIINPTSCDSPNGAITINVGGRHTPITHIWQNMNAIGRDSSQMPLDSLKAGTYTCIFYDTLKCYPFEVKNIPIIQNKPPKGFIYGKDLVCAEGPYNTTTTLYVKVTSGDSNSVSYLWNDGTVTKYNAGKQADTYSVIIKDNQGCADTPKYRVNAFPARTYNLIADKEQIVKGIETFIKIDTTVGLYNIRWQSDPIKQYDVLLDTARIRARPNVTTLYTAVANYGPGCETRNVKYIYIIAAVDDLVIPNTFTPNGDGRNDVYKMVGTNNTIKSFEFNVFDRWGNIIFAAYDQSFTWNGSDAKGEALPNGVYTYYIKYATTDAPFDKKIKSGSILIER
jgi:gliding motility-associated-like protein